MTAREFWKSWPDRTYNPDLSLICKFAEAYAKSEREAAHEFRTCPKCHRNSMFELCASCNKPRPFHGELDKAKGQFKAAGEFACLFCDAPNKMILVSEREAGRREGIASLDIESLAVDLCRELYDRFVMGGWCPEDAHAETVLRLHQWVESSRALSAAPPGKEE